MVIVNICNAVVSDGQLTVYLQTPIVNPRKIALLSARFKRVKKDPSDKREDCLLVKCNLIDDTKNYHDGKHSDLLAVIDVMSDVGKTNTFTQHGESPHYECHKGIVVNKITIRFEEMEHKMLHLGKITWKCVLEIS